MTLQESLELLIKSYEAFGPLDTYEIEGGVKGPQAAAIATILNAVVKGELVTKTEPRKAILDRFAMRNGHDAQRPAEDREAYNLRVYGLREEDI